MVTLIEASIFPRREGRADLVQAYELALLRSRQVVTLPTDAATARRAVDLRATHHIQTPDAIQITAALGAGATAFVTNDKRLAQVGAIRILLVDDYAT